MRKLLTLLLFLPLLASAQSETSNYITYDTTITVSLAQWTYTSFLARITRNRNYFTTDTASRVLIMTADGEGEQGTDTTKLVAYGPHYWMQHGWDGSVQLGNGTHYPIYLTIQPTVTSSVPGGVWTEPLLKLLIAEFHPRSIHVAGLSHGATLWGDLIAYAGTAGDTYPMQHINSYVAMSSIGGSADGNQSSYNTPFPTCFANWAKMGGRYFGLEGTADYRATMTIAAAMNAVIPGSAYEVIENDGGGVHCCWNDFYNPATLWQNVKAPYGNPWIVASANNAPGDYIGGNLYQWMLRQGDTILIGMPASPVAPVSTGYFAFQPITSQRIHAGDSVFVFATLITDNIADTITWTQLSGPVVTMKPSYVHYGNAVGSSSFWLSGLQAGTYVFNATGQSLWTSGYITDTLTVVAAPAPRTVTSVTLSLGGISVTVPASGLSPAAIKFNDGSSQ